MEVTHDKYGDRGKKTYGKTVKVMAYKFLKPDEPGEVVTNWRCERGSECEAPEEYRAYEGMVREITCPARCSPPNMIRVWFSAEQARNNEPVRFYPMNSGQLCSSHNCREGKRIKSLLVWPPKKPRGRLVISQCAGTGPASVQGSGCGHFAAVEVQDGGNKQPVKWVCENSTWHSVARVENTVGDNNQTPWPKPPTVDERSARQMDKNVVMGAKLKKREKERRAARERARGTTAVGVKGEKPAEPPIRENCTVEDWGLGPLHYKFGSSEQEAQATPNSTTDDWGVPEEAVVPWANKRLFHSLKRAKSESRMFKPAELATRSLPAEQMNEPPSSANCIVGKTGRRMVFSPPIADLPPPAPLPPVSEKKAEREKILWEKSKEIDSYEKDNQKGYLLAQAKLDPASGKPVPAMRKKSRPRRVRSVDREFRRVEDDLVPTANGGKDRGREKHGKKQTVAFPGLPESDSESPGPSQKKDKKKGSKLTPLQVGEIHLNKMMPFRNASSQQRI